MDDIEKRLSDALHDLTPEPPPFRFEPVDELGAGVPRHRGGRPRRPRTFGRPLLAAAAAVIVLGVGGAVAVVGGDGSSAPAAEGPVSRCAKRSDFQLFLTAAVVKRGEVRVTVDISNNNGRSCTLDGSPVVGLEPDVASSTPAYLPFPVVPRGEFVLRGHWVTELNVTMAAEGTCQQADERPLDVSRIHQAGLILRAPFGSTGPESIGVFGCRLTPTSVTLAKDP